MHIRKNILQPHKPFIKLANITLKFNDRILLSNINWSLETNQNWAVIGPNGSGKSLLVNAICRKIPILEGRINYFFNNPEEGEPFFNRGDILTVSPDEHQALLQHYAGYHQARWHSFEGDDIPTVAEFLSGKSIEHISPFEVTPLKTSEEIYLARREKALELFNISDLFDRKIHQLSNGEGRKVLIIRSLMQSPKLLILDDPFGGLDTDTREQLKKSLDQLLQTAPMKILLLTTRLEEIPEGITHILGLANRQIVFQGPSDKFRKNKEALSFLGFNETLTPSLMQIPHWKTADNDNCPVLVEMKHVSITYNRTPILTDINWTVRHGERWALLGHNGAGKSTLLSLITADNPQSYANNITLFGKRRGSGESIWEIKKNIGWVAPEQQIYSHGTLTCLETVCSGFFDSTGLFQECNHKQAKIAWNWLRIVGLDELAEELFGTISVSQQRLVLLARALVKNPILLVLDEPCQGLDLIHRQYINKLLDQLCEQTPISLIYITHHFNEIPKAITNILKLANGRIIEKYNK